MLTMVKRYLRNGRIAQLEAATWPPKTGVSIAAARA